MALSNSTLKQQQQQQQQQQVQPTIKKRSKISKRELETLNDNNSKRARRDLPKCPICEYRIEPEYWAEHYQYELNRLSEPTSEAYLDPLNKNKGKRGAAVMARKQLEGKGKKKASQMSVHEEIVEKIKKNRSKRAERLKQINNLDIRGLDDDNTVDDSQMALQVMLQEGSDIQTCFICNEQLFGDLEAINLHIDNCLSNSNAAAAVAATEETTEEANLTNDQQSPGWEEYEWAGQRRVRATAMMEGGYGGAGFATASKTEVEEEDDEDLDVEDDDVAQFGQSQYTERDIVVNTDDEDASALREMVSGGVATSRERQGFEETVSVAGWNRHLQKEEQHDKYYIKKSSTDSHHSSLVIESLKTRIHELERASTSNNCLICLEPYKTPLTSIVCWHVHCEQCWLRTLGTKKLCPQCQKITTPADLRRIYL
ncbi:uncharacterized protein BX663DRAFT_512083 [Cokeromyces recurvatus]|uniref:uncharacterized protein n=1 Tax=Cokeromyces recurvatus TaxID=90255 RepID=UPI00221F4404|nr:uncharacterized protein BX663DRAFT_512083 [Cokeromyces recurvatus]KAI7902203.1 hypothetical protein BX663DRAFT_512083 [Cokeromyces recurvatus]